MKYKGHENSGVLAGALVGALTNTVLVLSGIYVFFGNAYASSLNVAYSGLIRLLLGVVTTNGILEAILAAVVSLAVYKAMKPLLKK